MAFPAHSLIVWRHNGQGDTAEEILAAVLEHLRALNREDDTKARELSLAITHIEEGAHWLRALTERTGRSA